MYDRLSGPVSLARGCAGAVGDVADTSAAPPDAAVFTVTVRGHCQCGSHSHVQSGSGWRGRLLRRWRNCVAGGVRARPTWLIGGHGSSQRSDFPKTNGPVAVSACRKVVIARAISLVNLLCTE